MQTPLYQRFYRNVRYAPVVKPVMDVAAMRTLRTASAILTKPEAARLFLIGHMRSGSSLLSTIICQSPEINGYGEAKVYYRTEADYRTLRGKIALVQMLNRKRPLRESMYVFDKVLHKRLLPNPALLTTKGTRTLFLIRPAEQTLRSIVGSLD